MLKTCFKSSKIKYFYNINLLPNKAIHYFRTYYYSRNNV